MVTALLLEQLGWRHGYEALAAMREADFAARCIALYTDRNLWRQTRTSALRRIGREFSRETFTRSVSGIVDRILDL